MLKLAFILVFCHPACALTLKTVVHVHSKYSARNGQDMLITLACARQKKVDAVVLADDAIAKFEYGLPPLRNLFKLFIGKASVLKAGPRRWLSDIAEARKKFPDVVVIPGVEAAPFYRWAGGPVSGLTMHDWHRHMGVAGLENARDYELLPVLGNSRSYEFHPSDFWPLILVPLVFWLRAKGARRFSLFLLAALAVFLINGYPFRRAAWSQYDAKTPDEAYERLARYAAKKGALCFWHHPEAPNWSTPQRLAPRVSAMTKPYPNCLEIAPSTEGFAVFLEGDKTMPRPGGEWDRALRAYCRGMRPHPAWAFAELDYTAEGFDGTFIDTVYMNVRAEEKTAPAVLKALKSGAFESVKPEGKDAAAFSRWTISSGGNTAQSGESLSASAPLVEFSVEGNFKAPAKITLIKNGEVLFETTTQLPFSYSKPDSAAPGKSFYRLMVWHGANGRLVSNPIFVVNN